MSELQELTESAPLDSVAPPVARMVPVTFRIPRDEWEEFKRAAGARQSGERLRSLMRQYVIKRSKERKR